MNILNITKINSMIMNRILIIAFVLMTISMAYAQKEKDIVHIPDENFKRILLENKKINTNGDKEISYEEAKNCQGMIDVVNNNIKSLEGIEAFVNITMLNCSYNQLTSLDVSKNTALVFLDVASNQFTSLDISKNINLQHLDCTDNQFTSLDVSKNTALESLYCSSNKLISLDISKNIELEVLICNSNQLRSLDISKNIYLEQLECSFNQLMKLNLANGNNKNIDYITLDYNPNLKCIQIDKDFIPQAPLEYSGSWLKEGWLKDKDAKYSDTCK